MRRPWNGTLTICSNMVWTRNASILPPTRTSSSAKKTKKITKVQIGQCSYEKCLNSQEKNVPNPSYQNWRRRTKQIPSRTTRSVSLEPNEKGKRILKLLPIDSPRTSPITWSLSEESSELTHIKEKPRPTMSIIYLLIIGRTYKPFVHSFTEMQHPPSFAKVMPNISEP